MHPYIPFVTEEIYSKLPLAALIENRRKSGSQNILPSETYEGLLVTAPYPSEKQGRKNEKAAVRFKVLQDVVRSLRSLRTECGLDPALKLHAAVKVAGGSDAEVIPEKAAVVQLLAGLSRIDFVDSVPEKSIGTAGDGFEAFILADEGINKEQLKAKFAKEIRQETEAVQRISGKLSGSFAQNAPADIVQAERSRLEEAKQRIEKLQSYLKNMQ